MEVPEKVQLHMQIVSVGMFAGFLGGIINVLLRPVFNVLHLSGAHGLLFHAHLPFTAAELYHQAFWGALWGLMLCAPLHKYLRYFWARAFLFGVPPALIAMAVVVPRSVPHAGVLSLGLGWAAPLFIYFANSVGWSVPAYMWMTACGCAGDPADDEDAFSNPLNREHINVFA